MEGSEKINLILKDTGLSEAEFYKKVGLKSIQNVYDLQKGKSDISKKVALKILEKYPHYDPAWLIFGFGSRYINENIEEGFRKLIGSADPEIKYSISKFKHYGYSPFFSDHQVSAGKFDLANIISNEEPESYIKIPGVTAEAWFPVIGRSFEPNIYAGDIIGVRFANRWDRVDPDKIYMIITHEDRMIKRLRIDNDDPELLWCVSDNYKEFKLPFSLIKSIYHVVFVGRLC